MLSYLFYKIIRSDIENYTIPDRCSICIGIAGIIMMFARSFSSGAAFAPSGDLVVGDIMLRIILAEIIFIISGLVCGMGDAKLFAALALLIGERIWFVFAASFALCGAYCGISLITRQLHLRDRIAFAPFIASAALAVIITSASLFA